MSHSMFEVRVAAIEEVAPMIREFCFEPVQGSLPSFSPGSHILVEMPARPRPYRNAYSLLSDPRDARHYRIAVRLQERSRGGSRFMHEQVQCGDNLRISAPANLFAPYWPAKKHLLIAGGVGITPFLSFLPEFVRRQQNFELHYLFRSQQTGAYRDSLRQGLGQALHLYDSSQGQRCDLHALLARQSPGTHVYICGPQSLIDTVTFLAQELGWPRSCVHFETFTAAQPGQAFSVELARSGQTLAVEPEESLLEALEGAGVDLPNLCRGGVCGQCVTRVLEGAVEHRDAFLSAEEKSRQDCIMPCVSRAQGHHLKLDL
ncbi:PDR/VanB family oxidoreductase [Nitrincola tapanii]|uniref:Oxidoreductase n=1 Tax=Nitrincola tapanii TaxID=1708751 RepID=A0A5A9W4H0_9GAMM|nr:PDR/VanB family oxidoreductase [Nitrincola tapanii]KAA0874441.1 oxidoreductase [Nitrincola tapanii]